jgi:hypothetical protein
MTDRELPCIKKEDKRPVREYKYSVCKCGHAWSDHWGFLGMFLYAFTLGYYGEPCGECQCGMFRKLGKFTYEEMNSLKVCEDDS